MLRIKLLRMHRRLSQWDLSKAAGIAQGKYSMIERGLMLPTQAERARLACALDANASTLFRPVFREHDHTRSSSGTAATNQAAIG